MKYYRTKFLSVTAASLLMLSSFSQAAAATLNEFGSNENIATVEQLPTADNEQWNAYPTVEQVALNKTWKIKANKTFKEKVVKSAVIIIDGELMPVTIDGFGTKELSIKATHQLPGGKSGELRVYLNNGKNYKLPFTTKDEPRNIGSTSTYNRSITILPNEKVRAEIAANNTNYYNVNVKTAGLLKMAVDQQDVSLNITKEGSPLAYLHKDEEALSFYVTPGEYKIYARNTDEAKSLPILLETTLNEAVEANDKVGDDFEQALPLEEAVTYNETLNVLHNKKFDKTDVYKFTVDQKGTTKFHIKTLMGDRVNVEVLDSNQNRVDDFEVYDEQVFSKYLKPGDYYIKATNVLRYQVNYTLEKTFHQVQLTADEQQRYNELNSKWQQWKPTHEGEQASGVSTELPYASGEVHPSAANDALNVTKMLRFTTGLSTDVALNQTYSKHAQAASLVNHLNRSLSHSPMQPVNMDNELYESGYLGASSSNLGMGYGTIASSLIDGYMRDEDASNIDRVGHRRWILSPHLPEVGFGYVNRSTAMYVIGEDYPRELPHYDTIKWPAADVAPLQFFNDDDPFSISFNPKLYSANVQDLTVLYTVNGKTETLTQQNAKDFYLDKGGYGYTPLTLIFRTNDIQPIGHGDRVKVEVLGLKDTTGNPKSFSYETIFLELDE